MKKKKNTNNSKFHAVKILLMHIIIIIEKIMKCKSIGCVLNY